MLEIFSEIALDMALTFWHFICFDMDVQTCTLFWYSSFFNPKIISNRIKFRFYIPF